MKLDLRRSDMTKTEQDFYLYGISVYLLVLNIDLEQSHLIFIDCFSPFLSTKSPFVRSFKFSLILSKTHEIGLNHNSNCSLYNMYMD